VERITPPKDGEDVSMKTALALCALLWTGATAAAQEEFILPVKMSLDPQAGAQRARQGDSEWSAEFAIRYSLIGGKSSDSGNPKDKWDTFFSDGIGIRFEGDYEYHINPTWSIGGYVSTGFDFFGGKTFTTGGVSVSIDDWLIVPFTLGPKVKVYFGQGFFAEAYFGFGFVEYSATDFSGNGNSFPFTDSSLAFAFEVGGHIGYKFSQKFGLIFGFGYENWAAPTFNSTSFPGLNAKAVENVTIDLGIWFRF
jgi:hypothetical protein